MRLLALNNDFLLSQDMLLRYPISFNPKKDSFVFQSSSPQFFSLFGSKVNLEIDLIKTHSFFNNWFKPINQGRVQIKKIGGGRKPRYRLGVKIRKSLATSVFYKLFYYYLPTLRRKQSNFKIYSRHNRLIFFCKDFAALYSASIRTNKALPFDYFYWRIPVQLEFENFPSSYLSYFNCFETFLYH